MQGQGWTSSRASKTRSVWARARSRLKASSRASARHGDLGVGLEQRAEGLAFLPRRHGVALHDAVRLVAGQARRDQGEQHGLAEHEAVGALEVLEHAVGVHGHALDDVGRLGQHVVGQDAGVGQGDALDRAVGDVALVPQGHVLEPGAEVAAQQAGQARELLGLHRVALVGHGRRALLAGAERLLRLAHLGALEVADLGGDELDGGADRRAREQVLGVAVAGDDLGGGHRVAARGPRTRRPRPRGRCWSTCRPRPTACRRRSASRARRSRSRSRSACRHQRASLAPKVMGSACTPWVRPTIGVARNSRARSLQHGDQPVARLDEHVGGPGQGEAQGGVDHVGGREAVVDPLPGRRADALLHHVDEGGHVVVGDPLALGHRLDQLGRRRGRLARARSGPRRPGSRRARPTPRRPAPRPRSTPRTGPRR